MRFSVDVNRGFFSYNNQSIGGLHHISPNRYITRILQRRAAMKWNDEERVIAARVSDTGGDIAGVGVGVDTGTGAGVDFGAGDNHDNHLEPHR